MPRIVATLFAVCLGWTVTTAFAGPAKATATVAGDFRIDWNAQSPTCSFYLANKPIHKIGCDTTYSPEVTGNFKGGLGAFDQVLVVQEFPQGNACNGGPLHFIGLRANGTFSVSRPLDFCGGKDPVLKRTGPTISITFPGGPPNRGTGLIPTENWEYRDGNLKRLGTSENDDIAGIRKVYASVNQQLARFDQIRFSVRRPGAEAPSAVRSWADGRDIRKIEVTDYDNASSSDVVAEYYFQNGDLVFAYVATKHFTDRPGKQRTTNEDRQYYRAGRMFKWLTGMGGTHSVEGAEFAQEAARRLAAAAFYLKEARQAHAPQPFTTKIGNERKKTVGVLKALVAGDVACYLTLTDERGTEFTEMADFAICERGAELKGKRLSLKYELGKVLADECMGNPDCNKSKVVPLITSVSTNPPR